MKGKLVKGIGQTAVSALLCCAGLAWSQMTPQQHQQYLNQVGQYYEQQNGSRGGASQGPTAAEICAWEQREAEVQARIFRHKATPYWMAIGRDWGEQRIIWPGGYTSEQKAIEAAHKSCNSGNCEVFVTFANSCAVIVSAVPTPQSREDFFIGIDPDDSKAAAKAWQACQAVHGDREDRCFYSQIRTGQGVEGTAFCVGYDHSIYGQE